MMLCVAVVEGQVRCHSAGLHITLIFGRKLGKKKKKKDSPEIHARPVRFMSEGTETTGNLG